MKVELHVKGVAGSAFVPVSAATISYVNNVTVDGVDVWSEVGEEGKRNSGKELVLDADGFLVFKIKNVTQESWDRFVQHHGPDFINLVGDGTGKKVFEGREVVGLVWEKGCDLVVHVTEIATVEIPANAGIGDRSV
jgi:hypothetical protein